MQDHPITLLLLSFEHLFKCSQLLVHYRYPRCSSGVKGSGGHRIMIREIWGIQMMIFFRKFIGTNRKAYELLVFFTPEKLQAIMWLPTDDKAYVTNH